MYNKKDLKGFKTTANVISIILKVILVVSVIGLVGCAVGFLVINFMPKSMLENLLSSEGMITSISLSGLSFEINATSLDASNIVKIFSTALAGFSIILVLIILCLKQLIKIMAIVKTGTPFTTECTKAIKVLGLLIIISSFILPVVNSLVEYIEIKTFNIENLLLSTPNISNVTYNLFNFDGASMLIGFIILILAGVFEYGCYLQDEYDSTL